MSKHRETLIGALFLAVSLSAPAMADSSMVNPAELAKVVNEWNALLAQQAQADAAARAQALASPANTATANQALVKLEASVQRDALIAKYAPLATAFVGGPDPSLAGVAKEAAAFMSAANAFVNAYAAIAAADKGALPDLDPAGQPGVPTHCAQADAQATAGKFVADGANNAGKCGECFQKAQAGLNTRRFAFEQLRIIALNTQNMVDKGKAFMNAAGASGGVIGGAAAAAETTQVDQAMVAFNVAYKDKYTEILGKLRGSLDDLAVCEKQYFNMDDWFDRYGFIYYQFMADRYRR